MINVLNIRNGNIEFNENTIYCGRAPKHAGNWIKESVLHNPFKLKNESERVSVLLQFREYFNCLPQKDNFVKRLKEIHDKYGELNLACWCSPKMCHCNVIKEEVEKLYT